MGSALTGCHLRVQSHLSRLLFPLFPLSLYFHSYRQKSVTYCSHLLKCNRQRPVPFDFGLVMSNFTLFIALRRSLLLILHFSINFSRIKSYDLIFKENSKGRSYRMEWEIWWRKDCVVFPLSFLANKGIGAESWKTAYLIFFCCLIILIFLLDIL